MLKPAVSHINGNLIEAGIKLLTGLVKVQEKKRLSKMLYY